MSILIESLVEDAAFAWLGSLGYSVRSGRDITPGEPEAERADLGEVVLEDRLRQVLARLNPDLPAEVLDDSYQVTLAALRDTLLPKLLSGEIRVKDAEHSVAAHV